MPDLTLGQSDPWGQPTNWEPRTPEQRARDNRSTRMNYRKKPVVIQAVQWTGANLDDIAALAGDAWPGEVAPKSRSLRPTRPGGGAC